GSARSLRWSVPSAIFFPLRPEQRFPGTTVLEQALAASGGRIAWSALRDFRAAGTIALHSGVNVTQSGGAELIGRGMKQFRLTADFRDHTRSWLWNKGFGRLDTGNGKPGLIGRHN